MKLYEVNSAIEEVIEEFVDLETGEILGDTQEMQYRLGMLEMEKDRILEYLAKLVFNYRADIAAIKGEAARLSDRKKKLEAREERLLAIIDRECAGERKDLGIAEVGYRKSTATVVDDIEKAINWLEAHGYDDCLKYAQPTVVKSKAKELLGRQGIEIPGLHLEERNNMSLK